MPGRPRVSTGSTEPNVTPWSSEELSRIGQAEELQVAAARPDGTMRSHVTIWVVRIGDDLYIRSAYGPNNPGTSARRPAVSVASAPVAPAFRVDVFVHDLQP
jgi:hypothetical protein